MFEVVENYFNLDAVFTINSNDYVVGICVRMGQFESHW